MGPSRLRGYVATPLFDHNYTVPCKLQAVLPKTGIYFAI
jgi:hypothetical protein